LFDKGKVKLGHEDKHKLAYKNYGLHDVHEDEFVDKQVRQFDVQD